MKSLLAAAAALVLTAPASFAADTTVIRTIAGTGVPGYAGDGGPALKARFNLPTDVISAPDGTLYVADTGNNRVRRIAVDGTITTVAGTGSPGFSGDGGPAAAAALNTPRAIALGPDGTLYIADSLNHRIRHVGADGVIATVAGNGTEGLDGDGGPAVAAQLAQPGGVAVDPTGAIFISDSNNDRIRKVATDGTISTVAGNGSGFTGDGGPAALAGIDSPSGIALTTDGRLIIADSDNGRVRQVGLDGIITTIAGIGPVYQSTGDGGPATSAALNYPVDVTADASGSIFIADLGHRIRRIGPDGRISTVAGSDQSGFSGDLGPGRKATLQAPTGVAVDPKGRVLIADRGNQRIRRVGDLRPELGTVARAVVSAKIGGQAVSSLPATAHRMCGTFTFGEQPAAGLPLVIVFTSPRKKLVTVKRELAPRVSACVLTIPGAQFRLGRWTIALTVAGQTVKTVAVKVKPFGVT